MTAPNDLTLMQRFVSGDAVLEANQTLRIQPANHIRQLFGRKGKLLATAFDQALPSRIEVRRDTEYTDVLRQILLDHHFVPTGQGLDSPVVSYTHHPVPAGYNLVCTPARQLWKQWWSHPSRLSRRHQQTDLFVLADQTWQPIRSIALNSSTLYVETQCGESVHHGDDPLVWLEKTRGAVAEQTQIWAPSPKAPASPAGPHPQQPVLPVRATTRAAVVDPTLAPAVYALEDKIYVHTTSGLVIIEGEKLKAYGAVPRRRTVGAGASRKG
jgi:hypothetical protein